MPKTQSRRKQARDCQRMLDYVEMREDIRRELGRREDGDGEELGANGDWSQGKLQ